MYIVYTYIYIYIYMYIYISRKVAPVVLPWVLLYEVNHYYLIIQEVAVHFRYPPTTPPPQVTNPKIRPKHCNWHGFCNSCMEQSVLATCRKLRKYQCSCSVLSKKHCKYRGLGLLRRKIHPYLPCFLLRESQKNAKTQPIWRFSATTRLRKNLQG